MTGRVGARFRAVHIDFGTGDGAFARWIAAHNPEIGVIGVDASADGLREASRRALPTTWAKRLAFSGYERRFVELRGGRSWPGTGR